MTLEEIARGATEKAIELHAQLAALKEDNERLKKVCVWAADLADECDTLKARVAKLEKNALDLCDAVENKEEFPPAKFALRCLMIINRIRNVGPSKDTTNEG